LKRLESRRSEREQRASERAKRPGPIGSFFGTLFGPLFAWWSFVGMVPTLVYVGVGLVVALVLLGFAWFCLSVLRLFVGK